MRKSIYCLFAIATLVCLPSAAEIYKTTDKNGRVVYTDLPPANSSAKPVEMQPTNTIPKIQAGIVTMSASQKAEPMPDYEIQILQPAPNTSLSPEERDLAVSIKINISLEEGLFFAYLFDNNVVLESTQTSVTLNEPPRGEHILSVEIRNQNGDVFAKSGTVNFTVYRPILKQKLSNAPPPKNIAPK